MMEGRKEGGKEAKERKEGKENKSPKGITRTAVPLPCPVLKAGSGLPEAGSRLGGDVRTDGISPLCSTGHRPLSGPLPKKETKKEGL